MTILFHAAFAEGSTLRTTFLRRSHIDPARRHRLRSAVGLVVALLAAAPALARAQATSRITGTILNEAGQPIPSVQVTIPSTSLGSVTNEQGKYTITGIAPGTYSIRAQRIGYQPVTQRVNVPTGADAVADFQLNVLPASLAAVVSVGYT